VLATHLTEIIKRHADELLTRQEVNRLLENLKERSPKLVEELVPNVVKPGELQRVLQNLLASACPSATWRASWRPSATGSAAPATPRSSPSTPATSWPAPSATSTGR